MKLARNPWMKFYPADWRADAMLRLCCIAARGLWAEMMCIMHEAERYGSLLVNGKRIDKKQLAGLAGISERECTALLLELEGNGVFSRDDDGTIYSRRMRRDFEKAAKDRENGKGGGNPSLKGGVNPQGKVEDKAQKPEARSQLTGGGDDAQAREPIPKQPWELEPCHDLARQLAEIAKTSDEFEFTGWGGATYRVKTWLSEGWPTELILAAFREASGKPGYIPPHGIKYFEPIVARFIAQQQAPLPTISEIPAKTVEVHKNADREKHSGLAAIDRVFARLKDQSGPASIENADVVQLLPPRSILGP